MNYQPHTLCPCPAFFPQAALARWVPWARQYANAPLNPGLNDLRAIEAATGGQTASPANAAPRPCVRLAFALWYLPADQAQTLLHLALEAASMVLVADFKLAERNLELPASLAAQGLMKLTARGARGSTMAGANCAAHTDFMQRGGIEGLVYQSKALVHGRRPIFAGAAALLHLQRPAN